MTEKNKTQIDSFKEAVREFSEEMSQAEFDAALGRIGHAKVPKDDVRPAERRKRTKRKPMQVAAGKSWNK